MDQYLGPYVLRHLLGRSESSEVFLGEHRSQRSPVAIKRLHGHLTGEEGQEFLAHTSDLARLQHPRIVAIRDFGIEEGTAYLVMDYISQGTLRERHPRNIPVSLALLPGYLQHITEALAYLHDLGLVHRDIKPQNLLIDDEGTILLNDFGTATASFTFQPDQKPLQDFEGTVLYAAPEQLQGCPCRASDQYALAIMLYEWICGKAPFYGTFHEVVHQHLFIPPAPIHDRAAHCPANIGQVIMRALEKKPQRRFPDIKTFTDEFTWAYKVALARGHLAPQTPLPPVQETAEAITDNTGVSLSLPATPPALSAIKQPPRRQFKAPPSFKQNKPSP